MRAWICVRACVNACVRTRARMCTTGKRADTHLAKAEKEFKNTPSNVHVHELRLADDHDLFVSVVG